MADITTRPFSKNYSGLINQSVIGITIVVLCVTSHEIMKRKRRGKFPHAKDGEGSGIGSRESWEFGYLYQGRCWSINPSPPPPLGWPLAWVKQAVQFPEDKLNELRGVDAALYTRFLRGCFWFTLLHTLTTFLILFPIHVHFADPEDPPKSMTRASIASLVKAARVNLLWIHMILLFWTTLTWMATLLWICTGAFSLRSQSIAATEAKVLAAAQNPSDSDRKAQRFHPHPHAQYGFQEVLPEYRDSTNTVPGIRLRTVMVSNVPSALRTEAAMKEYFEYYMSRKIDKPSVGLTSSTQPGLLNKSLAFLFNRAKKLPAHLPALSTHPEAEKEVEVQAAGTDEENGDEAPLIERVVIVRKMTELASLLERREEILRLLETAHIKLAIKAVTAVQKAMDCKRENQPMYHKSATAAAVVKARKAADPDLEIGDPLQEGTAEAEQQMENFIKVLGPFVEEFGLQPPFSLIRSRAKLTTTSKVAFRKLRMQGSQSSDDGEAQPDQTAYPPGSLPAKTSKTTIWEALHSLPRSDLNAYQPLIRLNRRFRGQVVPSIDYYIIKLKLISGLIMANRAIAIVDYDPVSTAFVTFADHHDARRASKYLAVHPNNPLVCLVAMAPAFEDLDWSRVMKLSFNVEFVKDWVVNMGVWGFTIFWLFPVSLLVGLVSIQTISLYLPALKAYLDNHEWQQEIIQSFVPTFLVALLALLIPLILLLIAKKAHTITTLSALHDVMMTRYYKFLIVNVLVFFCVGTAAVQSILTTIKTQSSSSILKILADSFPTAGPFYVGWLIFTLAMHAGFEILLFGLPLIMYPTTRGQVTPRKRILGIRPRTFNFYYWLPTHVLVIHIFLVFAILNPVVIPFTAVYFFIETGVVKNQLLHVYAKNYEGNGQVILIRLVRYSLDGATLAQVVFLAYMVVLKRSVNVGLSAFLIVFTVIVKIGMTRMCRAQFEIDDIREAEIVCGNRAASGHGAEFGTVVGQNGSDNGLITGNSPPNKDRMWSWKAPAWVNLSYATIRRRPHDAARRPPNPFRENEESFARLGSISIDDEHNSPNRSPKSADYGFPKTEGRAEPGPVMNPAQFAKAASSRLVVPHPPPVPWDDQNPSDIPYDNPNYNRTISNAIWLPRDPFGKLDLDDTVDLHVALSADPGAGMVMSWLSEAQTSSPMSFVQTSSPEELPAEPLPSVTTTRVQYTGDEEIDLPPAIARRENEADIEQNTRVRRASTFRRKPSMESSFSNSNTGGGGADLRPRRPSTAVVPPQPRSFSSGTARSARLRSGSILSNMLEMRPTLAEPSQRPDLHAQGSLIAAHESGSRVSLAPTSVNHSRAQNVTVSEAIFHEVLEEEREAMYVRLEDEAAQAQSNKSWLTSWMYKKDTHEDVKESSTPRQPTNRQS